MRASIRISALAGASCLLQQAIAAQNFVPTPDDTKIVTSQNYPGASISYKATNSFCETTPGVKSFSGYVHLPSSLLADVPADYNASLFFWYFEARNSPSTAPLSIYVAGGPGESSLDDTSGFPCHVNPDSNSTTLNEKFSWNQNVNMLYIDQPAMTGFSYSVIVNGIKNLVGLNPDREFVPLKDEEEAASFTQTNVTVTPATISLPDPALTVNTTLQAARTIWHFAQVWFQEFPEHKTSNDEISIWGNSYAGYWAPAIFAHFERQNDKINAGTLDDDENAKVLKLGTIGLTNACIDGKIQVAAYPDFAYNNTYGIQAIDEELYESAKANMTNEGGCADMIDACRQLGDEKDPDHTGTVDEVNQVCAAASGYCFNFVQGALTTYTNINPFDIAQENPTRFPIDYSSAFFNQPWVQESLGVPINFTMSMPPHLLQLKFFFQTGDPIRRSYSDLEFLLQRGVNVAFVYGDRDYRCAWTGAESVSLALEHSTEDQTNTFRSAGYTDIQTNDSYVGGVVRQAGNLSFSRVFDAGHNVAAYQPETVFNIFSRAMDRRDIATGDAAAGAGYETQGEISSFGITNEVPDEPIVEPTCLVYSAATTCTQDQVLALINGTAVVQDFVVVAPAADGSWDEGDDSEDGDDGNDDDANVPPGGNNDAQPEDQKDAALGRLSMMVGTVSGVLCLVAAFVVPGVLFF